MPAQPEDVELLLEAVKNRQKFPPTCAKAYDQISKASEEATERIFFDHGGVSAWASYVLTKRLAECTGHIMGKAKRRRLLGRIEGQTVDDRRTLAVQLAIAIGPERERLQQIVQAARQRPGRPRRPRRPSPVVDNSEGDSRACGDEREHDDEAATDRDGPRASCLPPTEQLEGASVVGCTSLFPPYIAAAIKRIADPNQSGDRVAAISMSSGNQSDSVLRLDIMSNKVEYIAKELFNIHLESAGGMRHVYITAGTRVLPTPTLILKGGRRAMLVQFFGQQVTDAISATGTYQEEAKEGRDCTQCVSMTVPLEASKGAGICIVVPAQHAAVMRDQLYRR